MIPEFYTKNFVCGRSEITRGELESLPCPFCTKEVSDETMQKLADITEQEVNQRLGGREVSEDTFWGIWWEELEDTCNYLNIPYYEDMNIEEE